jgi:hypothetical protein
MPRYHFTVRNSDKHDEPDGTVLADDVAARKYAIRIIRELWRGDADNGKKDWTMEVTQDERLVWQLTFYAIEPDEAPDGPSGSERPRGG